MYVDPGPLTWEAGGEDPLTCSRLRDQVFVASTK
jgi:hypothetical protein